MVSHEMLVVARKFFSLADRAMSNGGFWLSAGGGTARIIISEISRVTGLSKDEVDEGLNLVGGQEWYADLYHRQNPVWEENYWSIKAIVKASLRGSK